MLIFVRGLSGDVTPLHVSAHETILTVKYRLFSLKGINVQNQHLIYMGRQLEDGMVLKSESIDHGALLDLIIHLKTGPFYEAICKASLSTLAYPQRLCLNTQIDGSTFLDDFVACPVNYLNPFICTDQVYEMAKHTLAKKFSIDLKLNTVASNNANILNLDSYISSSNYSNEDEELTEIAKYLGYSNDDDEEDERVSDDNEHAYDTINEFDNVLMDDLKTLDFQRQNVTDTHQQFFYSLNNFEYSPQEPIYINRYNGPIQVPDNSSKVVHVLDRQNLTHKAIWNHAFPPRNFCTHPVTYSSAFKSQTLSQGQDAIKYKLKPLSEMQMTSFPQTTTQNNNNEKFQNPLTSFERVDASPSTRHCFDKNQMNRSFSDTNTQPAPVLDDILRCFICNKRTKLACGFDCRCERWFCSRHYHPEDHLCDFNYKTLTNSI